MADNPSNVTAIRAARGNARRIAANKDDNVAPPQGLLPDDAPVQALGVSGMMCYFLDSKRQLIALSGAELSRLAVLKLFGQQFDVLYRVWPRLNKDGEVSGWRPELAQESLIAACSNAGVWDPSERVRGRGAWLGDNGDLVLHVGDRILSIPAGPDPWGSHQSHGAGMVARYVYPAGEPAGIPSAQPADAGPAGGAARLFETLQTWNWRRGDLDAALMLGWIGAAMIGGALRWRPMAWLTGGKGTGKSTMEELLKLLFDGALVHTSDASAAGLWQKLKHQSLPIAFDELEAEEDNRRALAVIKLARLAASGGTLIRGGQNHEGAEFTVRSAFLFSSILVPPLMGQDRSRMAFLELDELAADSNAPVLDGPLWRGVGAQLRRRLIQGWPRLEATLAHYRTALGGAGHNARGQDQFGTLLACADILLFDGLDPEQGNAWVHCMYAVDMQETGDDARDEELCLARLLTTPVDVFRNGTRKSMGEWIRAAAGHDIHTDATEAQKTIGTYGLKVINVSGLFNGRQAAPMLAIARHHQALDQLYQGTHWAGRSGSLGVYVQALSRLPGADRLDKPQYFGGVICRAIGVPLSVVAPRIPTDAQAAAD